ncbi:MAG: hypothetical protein ABJH85_17325 [Paracoccaceae bacterium]
MLFFVLGLAGIAVAAALPQDMQNTLSAEAAWIESTSALCLAFAGLMALFLRPLHAWAHISLLAFLLAEREFDARVLPEGSGLRGLIEWIDDGVLHNWVVIAVLGFWLIYGLLRFTWPFLLDNFRRETELHLILGVSVVLVIVSQVTEQLAKSKIEILVSISTLHIWEELLELYFSISILLIVVVGLRRQFMSR